MARTKVVVDPITRIEGHLRIEAQSENGRIAKAWASSTQLRGIEIIMQGRDPRDAWAFTQRICGVCTAVHAIASCRAVEDAPRPYLDCQVLDTPGRAGNGAGSPADGS